MISHQYQKTYDEFVSMINNKTEEETLAFLKKMDNKTCNNIALIQNENKFNLTEVIYYSKKKSLLSSFIEKLSFDTLDKLIQNIATHRDRGDVCSLQLIAEHLSSEVFNRMLNQISSLTCHKLAPIFFNRLDVKFLTVENFKVFLIKISSIINEYILADNNESKKFISYLSNHPAFFFTLLENLQTRSVKYILNSIPLTSEALASISFYKAFPAIFKENKNIGLKILSNAIAHPEVLEVLKPRVTQLKSIQFFDGGESDDLWSPISQILFSHAPFIKPHANNKDLVHHISQIKYQKSNTNIKSDDHNFIRTQGRTVLLQNKEGNIIAIKVKKKYESQFDLEKEYKATLYLKQNAEKLHLTSIIPTPIMIGKIGKILDYVKSKANEKDYEQFAEMVNDHAEHSVYVYEINPKQCDYFTYLHDARITDEVFRKASRDIVHDLFILLQKGMVFPQLADIFHNKENGHKSRYDQGRYIVLINLLIGNNFGGGRLTGWKKAVEYPNLRVSGLADLGDCVSLHDFIIGHASHQYEFVFSLFGARGGNHLIGNLIAEYQYILFLITGCRAETLTKTAIKQNVPEKNIKTIWENAASQILKNCAQAASILTQHSEEKITEHLLSIIDISRIASQMRYWMTKEYIQDVMNNKIRDGIYEPATNTEVNFKYFRSGTFYAEIGCSLNGKDQDLGAVNGQEPIKEVNNLIYRMVNYIFTSHHLLNETLTDLTKIIKEKDIQKSELLRKESFSFLPDEMQDNIQFSLGKERLKQNNALPEDIKSDIMLQQRKIAGNKIRRFWRSHQSVKRIDTMRERKRGL